MKVVIPFVGELEGPDARTASLAEFLGIPCQTLSLPAETDVKSLSRTVPDPASCLVVNPRVMAKWLGSDAMPASVISWLLLHFQYLIVHAVRADNPFDNALVATLSGNRLLSASAIQGTSQVYQVAANVEDVCEAFSSLSFGPANPANDCVFPTADDSNVRTLISIGANPFMATVKTGGAEVVFLGSADVADTTTEVGEAPLAEYFSRFVPQAMALRFVAGDCCWRPRQAYACIIIDDPLLRMNYGFLNFESLLRLADQHNFHAAIAFIPHNFRRNSQRIIRMFRENAARLSICFHGNDHTDAEFASSSPSFLNLSLLVAEDRMALHEKATGLTCDKVMVFPQGNFSVEAMRVLQAHNFCGAVNTTPHPVGQPVQLTIGELAQPAVLRYGGFPLFLRKPARQLESQDIAFNLFFGRPVLIVEHHDTFQHPEILTEAVDRINALAPEIRWSNLATALSHSVLMRSAVDGTQQVRAYSSAVRISNDSSSVRRYSIEWNDCSDGALIGQVLVSGQPSSSFETSDQGLRILVEIEPVSSQELSLVHRNPYPAVTTLGLRWKAQAFLRRRLSEFRDNYLSKNQNLLKSAKALQRRFLKI
jgi:hypothetical protein